MDSFEVVLLLGVVLFGGWNVGWLIMLLFNVILMWGVEFCGDGWLVFSVFVG